MSSSEAGSHRSGHNFKDADHCFSQRLGPKDLGKVSRLIGMSPNCSGKNFLVDDSTKLKGSN